jgi:DNA-binding response OmpR family regulator
MTRVKTVLLVDDDPALRRLVHITLGGGSRYRIVHAEDGASALKLACAQRVDLALLDVSMPGVDGFTLCRALKSLPVEARPVVAMLTAHTSQADRAKGKAAGADEYLGKPFSPSELLDTVDRLLACDLHRALRSEAGRR